MGLSRDNGHQDAGYPALCLKPLAYSFAEQQPTHPARAPAPPDLQWQPLPAWPRCNRATF